VAQGEFAIGVAADAEVLAGMDALAGRDGAGRAFQASPGGAADGSVRPSGTV